MANKTFGRSILFFFVSQESVISHSQGTCLLLGCPRKRIWQREPLEKPMIPQRWNRHLNSPAHQGFIQHRERIHPLLLPKVSRSFKQWEKDIGYLPNCKHLLQPLPTFLFCCGGIIRSILSLLALNRESGEIMCACCLEPC